MRSFDVSVSGSAEASGVSTYLARLSGLDMVENIMISFLIQVDDYLILFRCLSTATVLLPSLNGHFI